MRIRGQGTLFTGLFELQQLCPLLSLERPALIRALNPAVGRSNVYQEFQVLLQRVKGVSDLAKAPLDIDRFLLVWAQILDPGFYGVIFHFGRTGCT